jgi:hypothetical protein
VSGSTNKWQGFPYTAKTSVLVLLALGITIACLLALLAWMLDKRLEGYGFRHFSYQSIYLPNHQPALSGLKVDEGTLILRLTAPAALSSADSETDASAANPSTEGNAPLAMSAQHTLEVPPGVKRHELTYQIGAELRQVTFWTLRAAGQSQVTFYSNELLVEDRRILPLNDMTASLTDYPAQDVEHVQEILASIGLQMTEPVSERLTILWDYLNDVLNDAHGTPPDGLSRTGALSQFERARDGEVDLHCSNFAEIFALFATVAGIPTRIVDAIREVNGVSLAAHTFNEVYLPSEGKWSYVDLSLRVMSVHSGEGGPTLNTAQIALLNHANALNGIVVRTSQNQSSQYINIEDFDPFLRKHLTPNATYIFHQKYGNRFHLSDLLRRYLWQPELAYSIHGSNRKYNQKALLVWSIGLLGLLWVSLAGITAARAIHRRKRIP